MDKREIEALPAGKAIWDGGSRLSVPGLHVRAFPGKKAYYLYFRTHSGRQRKPRLGDFPLLSLDNAREIARAMLVQVALGRDPIADRQTLRGELTVAGLWERIWEDYWSGERFTISGHGVRVKRLWLKDLAPTFGKLKLSEVTAASIRRWHADKLLFPVTANRALEVLSRMYRWAEEQELRPQASNPCVLVKAHPERSRGRYASNDEIQSVGKILERDAETRPAAVAFIYLLIFTGARPSAIERAKPDRLEWVEKEGEVWGLLQLPDYGKSAGEKVVLPPQAMRALALVPGEPATLTGIKFPKDYWAHVREEAGCRDLWARDWRRTFATVGLGEGVGIDVLAELLNQKDTQTTKIYAKLAAEKRQAAAALTASRIEAIMEGKADSA